jgi:hypothetical protein
MRAVSPHLHKALSSEVEPRRPNRLSFSSSQVNARDASVNGNIVKGAASIVVIKAIGINPGDIQVGPAIIAIAFARLSC